MPLLEDARQRKRGTGGKSTVSDSSSNGGDKVLNKPKLTSSRSGTEMVKRTAVLLTVVTLVTAFPASYGSYADTEDLINELDRPSKYTYLEFGNDGCARRGCKEYDCHSSFLSLLRITDVNRKSVSAAEGKECGL